jgi:hypothetical protein
MAKRPIVDTEPRVQQLSDGLYRETDMGSQDLASAGLSVYKNPRHKQNIWRYFLHKKE